MNLLTIIREINASVSPVNVTALLRKSTAADFLQKVRDKRASECFPEGCSTEDGEAEELMEVNVGYNCTFFHISEENNILFILLHKFDIVCGYFLV